MAEKKEEYEIKKAEREAKKESERKETVATARVASGARGAKIFGWVIFMLIVIGGSIWTVTKSKTPLGEDLSVFYPSEGRDHIEVGAIHEPYNSNPPSSGPHYSNPARTGFYDEPLADETIVHNLEHGEIWIAYRPNVSEEIKKELKKFSGQYVIVTPREANDTDISVVSWTRVDSFNLSKNTLSETEINRISDFIKRYDNKGPENLRGAGHLRI